MYLLCPPLLALALATDLATTYLAVWASLADDGRFHTPAPYPRTIHRAW